MNKILERTVEKITEQIISKEVDPIITPDEAKELKRMTEYRLSDAIREGSAVSKQAYAWEGPDDSLCALSAGVAAAKARKYL